MMQDLGTVLFFLIFGVVFCIACVSVIARALRPRIPGEGSKEETYECGEPAIGSSWVRFDIRFYTAALVFIVFDVEVALLYPWARVFRELAGVGGAFVFIEAAIFIGVLIVGFIYVWARGDLDWVKAMGRKEE